MSDSIPNPFPIRRLPNNPNLEQLRKQAKELLADYRSAKPAAVSEVQQFERKPDATQFALHDAQRVLARSYGFKSWLNLKAYVEGVNVHELAEAVKSGNQNKVRSLLHAQPELVTRDLSESNEHRALHFAVLRRDKEMVRLLMEAGADARKGIYPHRDATSALAIARDREYLEIVEVIEDEERLRRAEMSCPNATVSPVQDQISAAISSGDIDQAIRLLADDPTLIQACDRNGRTPLHIAAQEANSEMLTWLLTRRANVNKPDIHGKTPLDLAALSDGTDQFPETAKLLLDSGAELTIFGAVALANEVRVRGLIHDDPTLLRHIDSRGGLLTLAVNHGHIEMVKLLLDLGADVDERNLLANVEEPTISWGMPLWCAALADNYAIAELLLNRGADPNANVYASGWPLGNAWNHPGGAIKNLLLAHGARRQPYMVATTHDVPEAKLLLDADTSEDLARELAWSAADSGCAAIVELAIQRLSWPPADERWHWVLIQPIRGATADRADREGHFASMAVLLQHGIDPNISRYGQTPLHFGAGYHGQVSDEDRARFAAMLIDSGASLVLRDDLLKATALGWACRWGWVKLAELLIARGAPVDEPDAEPWATPKAWAQKMGRDSILALLSRRHS